MICNNLQSGQHCCKWCNAKDEIWVRRYNALMIFLSYRHILSAFVDYHIIIVCLHMLGLLLHSNGISLPQNSQFSRGFDRRSLWSMLLDVPTLQVLITSTNAMFWFQTNCSVRVKRSTFLGNHCGSSGGAINAEVCKRPKARNLAINESL